MRDPKAIEGYEVPLYVTLTQPPLFGGVPRELCILILVLTLVLTIGLHLWWIGPPVGLGPYAAALVLTRGDAFWMPVLRRHPRQPTFLDW